MNTPGENAAEDDHDRDQAPDRVERDLERLPEWDDLALREVFPMRDDEDQHDQRQAKQQRRDHARHEQVRDRDGAAGGERVDHHVVRRRQQQRLQRAGDRDIDREQPRIAVLDHLRNHHAADRGGVGDGGA